MPADRQETLVEEPLAVIAREGHPCLRRRGLTLADLRAWEWVVPLPGTPAHAALQRVFAAAGLAPPPAALQASSAMFTRAIVACTDRLALTSHGQALEDERGGALRRLPLELPMTVRAVGIAVRESGEPSPDLRVVLEALRRAAGSGVDRQNEYLVRAS